MIDMTKRVCAFLFLAASVAVASTVVSPAHAQHSSPLSRQALLSKMKWRSVGPSIGGRVVTVDGVPSQPDLFYAGTVGGGVWTSANDGISWQNITDGKLPGDSASIGALAVAPSNPRIIYIGTGEDDIRNDMIPGDGIYKSTDAGKTWTPAGLSDTHTIAKLVVDPRDPQVVYAASMGHVFVPGPHRGIFKTTDGGKTWKKILFVDNKTGAIDLVMDPQDHNILYATMWQAQRMPWGLNDGGPGSGLYKSTDGGAHWTNISRHPGLPQGNLGRIGVSVVASHPNVVYTIVQAKGGGVFRSDDAGASWKRVNSEWKLRQRGFYYTAIYADPKDPNTIYVPNVDALFVSHNGGKTFSKLKTPHGDNHVVWINPDNTKILLEGNDGGVTVSRDGGKSWSSVHNQPTGQFYHVNLDDQFPFHIYGAQQDEGSIEGPSAYPGGIPLGAWHDVARGESTVVVPQPNDPAITYGSDYFSIFVKYSLKDHQFQSVSPWPYYLSDGSSRQKYRFGWTHPILFSPTDPSELLIGAQYVLRSDDYGRTWKRISPDLTRNDPATEIPSGGSIDLDQSGAEIYPIVSSIAVSPLDGNLIWAGSDDGLVHVTTDGGKSWKLVTPPALPDCEISSIEPSHFQKDTAYMTAWRYMWDDYRPFVYKTTDLGQHWTLITHGLPANQFAYVIRQDPHNARLFFLGTYSSVYVSFDGAATWQPLKLNLPTAEVRDIAINSRQGDVVVATHGRAFWVLDNLKLLEQLTEPQTVTASSSAVFAPEDAWLTHDYGTAHHGSTGYNPPFGATVFFHVPSDYQGKTPVSLAFYNPQGQLVRKFALHLETPEQKAQKAGKLTPSQKAHLTEDESGEDASLQMNKDLALLTAIAPGMNRFQWDLRYPYAVPVTGYHIPEPEGDLANMLGGPTVVPGKYTVVLDYGGHKSQQSFLVRLDPRLPATQQDLEAELAFGLKVQNQLNALDVQLNRAIAARDQLQKAVAAHTLSKAQATPALNSLNQSIESVLQTKIDSSEGDLLHPNKLRSLIAYVAEDVNWAFARPTPAQYAVYQVLEPRAIAAGQSLKTATAKAEQLLH
jgi:photosystem II stability/assembly factor-like uncharacterized protein